MQRNTAQRSTAQHKTKLNNTDRKAERKITVRQIVDRPNCLDFLDVWMYPATNIIAICSVWPARCVMDNLIAFHQHLQRLEHCALCNMQCRPIIFHFFEHSSDAELKRLSN